MKSFHDFGIELPPNSGGEVYTTCPQCSHTRKKKRAKCLSVNTDEGIWCCHHCGWSGSLKAGTRRTEIAWAKPTYTKPRPSAPAPEGLPEKVVAWFAGRGIPADVLTRNQIGYSQVYMPQKEEHVNAVSFPYYRDGELINIKWRDGQKNFRLETGAERIPFGLDDVRGEEVWIWVEGEMDKLAFEAAGFLNVLSVPTGAPTPESRDYSAKFDYLENCREQIEAATHHILAVDGDAPGKALEDELARRLGREKCRRVSWPEGCKDANEVLKNLGPNDLVEVIVQAQPFPVHGVFDVLDLSDRIDHLFQHGYEKGVSTGWPILDDLITIRPGEMTIVTGIPNSGKSNWVDALVVNLAKTSGWRTALFSPENQPLEDHMARIIEKLADKPFMDGPTPRMTDADLQDTKRFARDHFCWILPDDDTDWTVDRVLEIAKEMVFRKGIRALVIDPWNELEHSRPGNMTETEYVSVCLKRIRQWGRKHGVHMFVVAHPQKLYKQQDGNYPVPTPYDISGSAHFRNKADNCVTVWRNFNDPHAPIEIHVQKIRFRQIGKIGMAPLGYVRATATYSDLRRYAS